MLKFIVAQFGRPSGPIGRLVGNIMAHRNRERIEWTVACLDIQPTDRVLEIGFGPGLAIEQVAKRAVQGFVAGLDHSAIMVEQASKRNRAAIDAGLVVLQRGSVTDLPRAEASFAEGSFDKAFAINSLLFWPAPVENLRQVGRMLKPHGRIAIVSQPRSAKSEADVAAEGAKIEAQLAAAGFSQIERSFKIMQPISAAYVTGIKA